MGDLLTTKQVQELLQIDRTTIYRMLKDGRLTGAKVGNQWRFQRHDVETLLHNTSTDSDNQTAPTNGLAQILPLHCIQAIQDIFADIIGVGWLLITTEGQPLTTYSHGCRFCQLLSSCESSQQACRGFWRQMAAQPEQPTGFATCPAGFNYTAAPIDIGDDLSVVLIAGQFYAHPPDRAAEQNRLRSLAATYDLDAALLIEAAQEIPVLDDYQRDRINTWLTGIAHTFEWVGHDRAKLIHRLQNIAEISTFE